MKAAQGDENGAAPGGTAGAVFTGAARAREIYVCPVFAWPRAPGFRIGVRNDGSGERGCWLGTTVVRVAAPVPWVPAYAGTTVVGVRGCW